MINYIPTLITNLNNQVYINYLSNFRNLENQQICCLFGIEN